MRILSLLLCCFVVLSFAAAPASCATAPPALQLGESRPLETSLGNPDLPTAQSVWIDLFRGATRSIDLEEFYFSHRPGEALQPVLDELGRAAARGVKVRLLLDAGMYRRYPQPADSFAAIPNISFRSIDYRRLAGGVQHSKFIVVDGQQAWIGSQNLDWRSFSHVHELGIRIRDEHLAAAVSSVFEADWAGSDTTHAFAPGRSPVERWPLEVAMGKAPAASVTLAASPRATTPAGLPWDLDLILARLADAKREVSVQVMQYGVGSHGVVDSTLHRALLATAARGVHVRMVVSDWALGGSNEPTLRDLAAHGIELEISRMPEWSHGYIPFARVEHCKYMVVDGEWLWIGTSNWEPSYFFGTRNLGLTIHDRALAQQALAVFAASWSAPTAARFTPDTKLPPREHGEKAPAGATVYGE